MSCIQEEMGLTVAKIRRLFILSIKEFQGRQQGRYHRSWKAQGSRHLPSSCPATFTLAFGSRPLHCSTAATAPGMTSISQAGRRKESKGQEAGGHASQVSLPPKASWILHPVTSTSISLVRTRSRGPLSCKGVWGGKNSASLIF